MELGPRFRNAGVDRVVLRVRCLDQGWGLMDASECRRYARQCRQLARELAPLHRNLLLNLAEEWRKAAGELEELAELDAQK
jgi:hypothetical protein